MKQLALKCILQLIFNFLEADNCTKSTYNAWIGIKLTLTEGWFLKIPPQVYSLFHDGVLSSFCFFTAQNASSLSRNVLLCSTVRASYLLRKSQVRNRRYSVSTKLYQRKTQKKYFSFIFIIFVLKFQKYR